MTGADLLDHWTLPVESLARIRYVCVAPGVRPVSVKTSGGWFHQIELEVTEPIDGPLSR